MNAITTGIVVAILACPPAALAQGRAKVGILPFDVVSVQGAASQAGQALARTTRLELAREKKVTPVLLELPQGQKHPLDPAPAAAIGKAAGVDLVILGTVLDTNTSRSSTGANTGRVLSGVGVGGRVSRTRARVLLYVQLVDPASGRVVHEFEAEGSETDVGVGADVWSTIGRVGTSDDRWLGTPMGKAIRQAARKIAAEAAKRAEPTRKPPTP